MALKTLYCDGKPICTYEAPADQRAELELCNQLLKQHGLLKTIPPELTLFNQATAFANTSHLIWHNDLSSTPVKTGIVPARSS